MSGVFGAGVVTRLQELNFYNKIEAVYATSAGVMNGAAFLAKQMEIESSIYYEDLIKNFIFPENIPRGALQRIWNGYIHEIPRKKILQVINIDYLIYILKNKKPLDIQKIKKQKIPLYAKLLNLNTGKIEYFDIREGDVLQILKAAVSILPYDFVPEIINGKKYADGSIKEPIGLKYLLEKYPENKIVIVLNILVIRGPKHHFSNFLEAVFARPIFKTLYKFFMNRENSIREDIILAGKNQNRVLLIHPPLNNPTTVYTTDAKKLKITYEMGKKEANKIKEFIEDKKHDWGV